MSNLVTEPVRGSTKGALLAALALLLPLSGCTFLGLDADAYHAATGSSETAGGGGAGAGATTSDGGTGGLGDGGAGGGATPTCDDGARNGSESDVDCGGTVCGPCTAGDDCALPADCTSSVCTAGTCAAPACDDGILNGGESSADCGGGCACDDGKPCGADAECKSGKCAGTCQPASCSDGVKNGAEGGLDCGGPCPSRCADGEACTAPLDCASSVCTAGICQAPLCTDGVMNASETDVDCGGSCPANCADQGHCGGGQDCQSAICDLGFCVPAACIDDVKNGAETAKDCGGPMCAPCDTGLTCALPSDCKDGVCSGSPKKCAAPLCTDGVKNGTETAKDCGGLGCAACIDGLGCLGPSDCQSGVCGNGTCSAPTCSDGVDNGLESDVDCGGTQCSSCDDGEKCVGALDCVSGACTALVCSVWSARSAGDSHDFLTPGTAAPWSDGGFVIVGHSASTNQDLGGGPITGLGGYDGFVARYTRTGAQVFQKHLGGPGFDFAYGVATQPSTGRIAVVGAYSGAISLGGNTLPALGSYDAFAAVLSPTGAHLWSVGLGGSGSDELRAVAFTPSGDVVATGAIGSDALVVRLDGATGATVWQKTLIGAEADLGRGIATDAAGDVFVTGSFDELGNTALDLGEASLPSGGGRDAFIAKLAGATGATLWATSISNGLQADGYSVLAIPGGDVIVAGSERGGATVSGGPPVALFGEYDLVLARLAGTDGSHVWSVARGGVAYDTPGALALDAVGRVVVVGSVGSAADLGTGTLPYVGSTDVFVAQVDPSNGATFVAKTFGGAGQDDGAGVAIGVGTGDLFVVGQTSGAIDFGDGSKSKSGTGFGTFWASLGSAP